MNGISSKFKPSDRRVIWMWLLVQLALYLQVLQLSQLGRGLYLSVHRASKSLPYSGYTGIPTLNDFLLDWT